MNLTFECDGYEIKCGEIWYILTVYAEASYSYDPGCMYLSNGDPGYPPEESFEISHLETSAVTELDTGKIITDKELIEKIEEEVCDELYRMDLNKWTGWEEYPEEEEEW